MVHSCPECEYETESSNGLKIHFGKSHPNSDKTVAKYQDSDWLQEQLDSGSRPKEIAKNLDVSVSVICKWIKDFDLDYKSRQEHQSKGDGRYRDKEYLQEKYIKQEMSITDISNECNVTPFTVRYWLQENDIEPRSISEGVKVWMPDNWAEIHGNKISGKNHPYFGLTGKDHPAWKGGNDWRDTGKWDEVRHKVYRRDDLTCQDCGATDTMLHAHHLTPVNDGGDKYNMENLVTLCKDCHFTVHSSIESDWIEVSA
jgi:5-methylcytosine-specific restriction endonuclease McrA/transposase